MTIKCPNKCGKCCEVIVLDIPKKAFKSRKEGNRLLKLLYRISKKEAMKRNPNIKKVNIQGCYFYGCNEFESTLKECQIYEDRPYMCREFPYYGGWDVARISYLPGCYFANQLMSREEISSAQ